MILLKIRRWLLETLAGSDMVAINLEIGSYRKNRQVGLLVSEGRTLISKNVTVSYMGVAVRAEEGSRAVVTGLEVRYPRHD